MHEKFQNFFITVYKIAAIAISEKIHLAAKKCCGWEEPAICILAPVKTEFEKIIKMVG